jgi:signal transduction histidine kinase
MTMQPLARTMVETLENERRRLADELHDGPVQGLAALQLNLERVRMILPDPDAAREAVGQAILKLSREVQNLRRTMASLRPPNLADGGIVSAIERHISDRSADSGLSWHVELPLERRLPVESETVLYRVMQEAVTNVIRHARARSISVQLGLDDGAVRLRVTDDGIGFDPQDVAMGGPSFGLTGMRELLAIVGGNLDITSGESGTDIRATIPAPSEATLGVAS